MTEMANQYGKSHRFRVKPLPSKADHPDALPAKRCRCEDPWLERDEEQVAHCARCGRDV